MKKTYLIAIAVTLISGCTHNSNKTIEDNQRESEITESEIDNKTYLKWSEIKNKFPNKNIFEFDFDDNGLPLNNIENIAKVSPLLFNELTSKIESYKQWKEYMEVYFFSLIHFDDHDFGVFLTIQEFDGTKYSFDLIKFDENGQVLKFENIANSWIAAECMGFTKARIDVKSKQIIQEKIQKCFDEESEIHKTTDSTTSTIPLYN